MLGHSFNLVEMIRSHLTADSIDEISSVVGGSSERTRLGIAAAVPGILSALDRTASTSEGVRLVNSEINNIDDGILDNVRSALSRGLTSDPGSETLRSIIGSGEISDLKGFVGRASGLSGKAVSSLLGLLAPVVFAVLKRVKRATGPDSFDVAGLLVSQRPNIAAAMPEGARDETYAGPRAGARHRTSGTYTARREHRWPWATLALLIGGLFLLWHWFGRPAERAFVPSSRVHAAGEEGTTGQANLASLERLITKYDSVLTEARAQRVQISDFREDNGKLSISGTAPSLEAANNVWNEIKRINPTLDDITADFQIASTAPSATEPMAQTSQTYTVQSGDTLSSISKHFYGTATDYTRILNANRDTIENENVISVGQELSIP
jgi:hypothetical protein